MVQKWRAMLGKLHVQFAERVPAVLLLRKSIRGTGKFTSSLDIVRVVETNNFENLAALSISLEAIQSG